MDMDKLLETIEKKILSYDVESMSMEEFEKYMGLILRYKDLSFFYKHYSKIMTMGFGNFANSGSPIESK